MTMPREYVLARTVLLDALDALGSHLDSFILVGAQAVYAHTADDTGVAGIPMTTDGDLMVDATLLASAPEITGVLARAGFRNGRNPGSWVSAEGVGIDIMVCPHQSGRSSSSARAADLSPHGKQLARITAGLEPALIDHQLVTLRALDPKDSRAVGLKLAGPAALIAAKLIKISERAADAAAGRRDRSRDKDAVDVLRLLVSVDSTVIADGFRSHVGNPEASSVSREALEFLRDQQTRGPGNSLIRLVRQGLPGDPVALAQWNFLVGELLDRLGFR